MCELFAMFSRKPSTLNYSINELSKHGGLTHSNKTGWGIAYIEATDAFLVIEALPKAVAIAVREGEEVDRIRT